ncbi:MAG TPA: hypothetical protein VNF27_12475 [Candidatus Binataceae bacterium]|nr:hypothetical protein [Candidatus Binataceae bacterium]
MRAIRHPLSGAIYDLQPAGTVRVEKDGKTGLFSADGKYISGDIYSADPHLCGWIGGRDLPSRHREAAEARRRK